MSKELEMYKLSNRDENLFEFFVVNCPVSRKRDGSYDFVSKKGKEFQKLNYVAQDYKKLLNAIKKDLNNDIVFTDKESINHVEEEIKKTKKYRNTNFEYIGIIENPDYKKTKSIYYMIRNAFAHGDFEYDKGIYVLRSMRNNELKAIMRLKYSTLIKLRDRYINKDFD